MASGKSRGLEGTILSKGSIPFFSEATAFSAARRCKGHVGRRVFFFFALLSPFASEEHFLRVGYRPPGLPPPFLSFARRKEGIKRKTFSFQTSPVAPAFLPPLAKSSIWKPPAQQPPRAGLRKPGIGGFVKLGLGKTPTPCHGLGHYIRRVWKKSLIKTLEIAISYFFWPLLDRVWLFLLSRKDLQEGPLEETLLLRTIWLH